MTIELVCDPPGHVRLPINDDEIIDGALVIQSLAGREVTLLTYGTCQSTRARSAGLHVHLLSRPVSNEPVRAARRVAGLVTGERRSGWLARWH